MNIFDKMDRLVVLAEKFAEMHCEEEGGIGKDARYLLELVDEVRGNPPGSTFKSIKALSVKAKEAH